VRSEPHELSFEFASTDEFTRFRIEVSVPLRMMLERCTPEVRQQILRATAEAAAPFRRADGSLRLPNETICVSARS
jgi:hypothetical protein